MPILLGQARDALRETLTKMCDLPESLRPFCVFRNEVTGRFVQFAGSRDRLFFDAPQLGIYSVPVPGRNIDLAVNWAMGSMMTNHRLPADAEVVIVFETTRPKEGRS